ncbi:MAG: thiamine phosphate synthase [Vicinamibacterales bacterium]
MFPPLYPIVDTATCVRVGRDPLELARACVAGGAMVVQLRAKELGSGAFLDLARALVAAVAPMGGRVIVNDRADIAALAGAAGVHVGQDDLPVDAVRAIVGRDAIIGLSTHTEVQLEDGLVSGADYLAIGPVFGTGTKDTGYEPVGLPLVRRAAALAGARNIPLVAIGGITLERAPSVIEAGAATVAVIGDLVTADTRARVRAWLA